MSDLSSFLINAILVSFLLQLIQYPDKSNSREKTFISAHSLSLQTIIADGVVSRDRLLSQKAQRLHAI